MIGLVVFVPALIVTALVTTLMIELKAKKTAEKTGEQRFKEFDEYHAKQLRKCQCADDVNFWQLIVTAVVTAIFLVWSVINGDWN